MNYKELSALPPEAYLDPENFRTATDHLPPSEYAKKQHETGLLTGLRSKQISIAINSVWGAIGLDGSSTSSYEGIGYHSCTADLLRGFLDSGCRIIIHRQTAIGVVSTVVRDYCAPHPLVGLKEKP